MSDSLTKFSQRALVAAAITLGLMALLYLLYSGLRVLLLVFGAVLVGALFRGAARMAREKVRMRKNTSVALVVVVLLALFVGGLFVIGKQIVSQVQEFGQILPQAIQGATQKLQQYPWGQQVLNKMPAPDEVWNRVGSTSGQLSGAASGFLTALVDMGILLAMGLYLAFQPGPYTRGILHLVPKSGRGRGREVLSELDMTLQHWLMGRLFLMFLNGSITALALWALGIKLPFALGAIAGVLNFVPNIGPLIASVPAILIAFMDGPEKALYVAGLYLVVQMIDGMVLTPLVDKKTVELPPVLTIAMQLLAGLLVGPMGVVLASPFVAVVLVMVRMLYVEDILGDRSAGDSGSE
jgi:predicted PurR-regulated permease PerM